MNNWFRMGAFGMTLAVVGIMALGTIAFAQGPQPAAAPAAITGAPLDAATVQALKDALNDEYKAHAFYAAVIAKFGAVNPFANIVQAEATHIQAIQSLMATYGVPVPSDTFAGQIQAPSTVPAAIQAAIDAEKANVAMYDRFTFVKEPAIVTVFTQLRTVSQTRHLPAFETALAGYGASSFGAITGLGSYGGRWGR